MRILYFKYLIVSTVSGQKEAKKAHGLIKNKLSVCTNIIPGVTSMYFRKDEVCEDNEHMLLIKTRRDLFEKVRDFIAENHSYDRPEVIMLTIEAGSEGYLNWIKENTV